ncbi:MAG: universal stress protein [Actinomycetota bacterium]
MGATAGESLKAERVLVVVDGSTASEAAVEQALGLLGSGSARLILLHVTPPRLWRGKGGNLPLETREWDQAFASETLNRAAALARARGVKPERVMRVGPPVRVVLEEAARIGCDMIVLGAPASWEGWPLRSLAELVRDTAPCPVKIVSGEGGEHGGAGPQRGDAVPPVHPPGPLD